MNEQHMPILPLKPMLLQDKVILVIGATGCLGREVSRVLSQQGAQTILLAKQIKALEKLHDELESLGPHAPALHAMNLMNIGLEQASALGNHINQLFGRLDGIVFCSGRWGELTPIEHFKESVWLEIMHLNLNVPFLLTKNLMPLLRKTKDSTVLFTQSPMSTQTKAYHGAFNCAQSGLNTLMELLHLENSYTSTRFIGINPVSLDSPTRRKLYPADPIPQGLNQAKDIAPYFAALLGPDGDRFKGKTLTLTSEVTCTP